LTEPYGADARQAAYNFAGGYSGHEEQLRTFGLQSGALELKYLNALMKWPTATTTAAAEREEEILSSSLGNQGG